MNAALLPGTRFARRYEIEGVLKTGGMGAVYAVLDTVTKRRRALKVMLPSLVADPALRDRFAREATVAAAVQSEHIVETFDAGIDEESGAPFLVMELLRGGDLEAELERRGALPKVEVVTLLAQVAMALDKTHAAGIVHRDLKPANLFLATRDDGSPRILVLDFGIAKAVAESGASGATAGVGTPIYMPPEQLSGGGVIGARSDLYALAHVAFTLLTGAPYWEDELVALKELYPLLSRILLGPKETACARAARRGVTLPAAVDAWFTKGIAADPADRFPDARSLVRALALALEVPAPPALVAPSDVVAATERATTIERPVSTAPTTPAALAALAATTPAQGNETPRLGSVDEALATQHAAVSSPLPAPTPGRARPLLAAAAVAALGAGIAVMAYGSRSPQAPPSTAAGSSRGSDAAVDATAAAQPSATAAVASPASASAEPPDAMRPVPTKTAAPIASARATHADRPAPPPSAVPSVPASLKGAAPAPRASSEENLGF